MAHLSVLVAEFGEDVPYAGGLARGFPFRGARVPFLNYQKGIYRAAVQSGPAALSIQTSSKSPYDDEILADGFLYAYRAGAIDQPDNRALRAAHGTAGSARVLHRDDARLVQARLPVLRARGPSRTRNGARHPWVSARALIEGKRTERGSTRKTTWMPVRHQMLRNLDDVWDGRKGKRVVAFFIVEGCAPDELAVPTSWQRALLETVSAAALDGSLPHRSPHERGEIANAFAGATTWQQVCRTFEIPWTEIRDLEVG
jgi:hypothetical protein